MSRLAEKAVHHPAGPRSRGSQATLMRSASPAGAARSDVATIEDVDGQCATCARLTTSRTCVAWGRVTSVALETGHAAAGAGSSCAGSMPTSAATKQRRNACASSKGATGVRCARRRGRSGARGALSGFARRTQGTSASLLPRMGDQRLGHRLRRLAGRRPRRARRQPLRLRDVRSPSRRARRGSP